MTLHKRLARMEAKRGPYREAVTVIFFCEPRTGEPGAALLMGGGGIVREPGEAADAFTARAEAGAAKLIRLHSQKFGGIRDALGEE
jgi:hypothetical protein